MGVVGGKRKLLTTMHTTRAHAHTQNPETKNYYYADDDDDVPLSVTSLLSSPASCTVTPAADMPVMAPVRPANEMEA